LRLALAQINPTIGDLDGNAALIASAIARARSERADLVALPELCLCGYPPKDLLLHEGFVESCTAAAKKLGETETRGLTAVFGLPLPVDPKDPTGPIANALVVYRDNRYVEHYDKRLLPTYDVFDENRYFTPGDRPATIDLAEIKAGLAICEDLWKGEDAGFASRYAAAADPVLDLSRAGAKLLLVPSASPFVLGKGQRHRHILQQHAKQHGMFVASVNQVGGNDDLVFDGHAALYSPDGQLLAAAPGFEEHVLIADLVPPTAGSAAVGAPVPPVTGSAVAGAGRSEVPDPLLSAKPEELLYKALVLGIRDYLRKTGFNAAVLGISGGIDSALVGALAAAAIGAPNITGLILPSKYSSEHSKADAHDLASRLAMRTLTIPIDQPFEGFRAAIDPAFASLSLRRLGEALPDITEENLQSRARGTILMTFSNRTGAIVLTTGNKSELAVGYATLYGDMNGGLAPISDISKQQVYALARWINANHRACGFAQPPIPERSIAKPPSAELRPDQTDQDSLPPYDVLDAILERYVERRQSTARIIRETGCDRETVLKVARLVDLAEYKRKQAAVGLKVTTVAFGSGRRVPIAQRWKG
jgi:NAD+ synthetase